MPFEFDMQVRASAIARQHVGERRDMDPRKSFPKPGTGVKRLECGQRLAGHWTSTVGRAVDCVIMDNDEVVVTGQVHVEFEMACAHLERQVKGSDSILW